MGRGQHEGDPLLCIPGGLGESLSVLLQASLAPSTRAHYERAWRTVILFFQGFGAVPCLPIPVAMILLFMAHVHANGSAPASSLHNFSSGIFSQG